MAKRIKFTCHADPLNLVSWEIELTPQKIAEMEGHYRHLINPAEGEDAAWMHCPTCDAPTGHSIDILEWSWPT